MSGSRLSLRQAACEAGSELALLTDGTALTYAELADRVAAVHSALVACGIPLGASACVALQAPNSVDTLLVILALAESGTPFVPLHPRLTAPEVAVLLADARPQAVLRGEQVSELAARPAPPTAAAQFAALPPVEPSQPYAILYTSGTSGVPKGAVLTGAAFLASARASAQNLGVQPDDRWLLCLPLCHVGGLSIVTRCLVARRAILLVPRAEPAVILAAAQQGRATLLSVVPTVLSGLLRHDSVSQLRSLRTVLVGGAATPEPLYRAALDAGLPVLRTYGLTEACSQVTTGRYADRYQPQPGSGVPLPGLELLIRAEDGAAPPGKWPSLPPGTPGRIVLRGPMLMSGYLHHAPLAGRPFDTGDLGFLDESGALHVLARRTDLIVTGGENVYPAEVEAALLGCPGVAAALVFGVPDPLWGALVAAAVVPDPDNPASAPALADLLSTRLASFKRPRLWCTVSALPQLPNGKPDRRGAAVQLAPQLQPLRDLARLAI